MVRCTVNSIEPSHNTKIYLFGYGTEYSTANFTEVTVVFIIISPKLVLVT